MTGSVAAGADGTPARLYLHIYGDSLSMPRFSEGIAARETYPELLQERWRARWPQLRVQIYNRSAGGAPITQLAALYNQDVTYFSPKEMDILVVQCGIVDCAPRPVPGRVRTVIGRLPGPVRTRVVRLIHDNRARLHRRGFAWQRTPALEFREVYRRWLADAAERFGAVRLMNIAPTTPAMEAHSPGLSDAIASYNEEIRGVVASLARPNIAIADVHGAITAVADGLDRWISARDGHHITAAGHALYAELLDASLEELPRIG